MNETIVKKFRGVPQNVKAAISSPEALERLERLEDAYGVSLAETLIRVAVKELPLGALPTHFVDALGLSLPEAKELAEKLERDLLAPIADYLRSAPQQPSAIPQPQKPQQQIPVIAPSAPTPKPVIAPKVPRTAPPPPRLPGDDIQRPAAAIPTPQKALTPPPVAPRLPSPPPAQQPQAPKPAPQPTTVKSTASYVVSAEDEVDIAKHRDRLAQMGGASPTADLERVIASLIRKRALRFASPVLEKRFVTAVLSRLRDVRTSAALQEILARSEKVGGLGFEPQLVGSIVVDVDTLSKELHATGKIPVLTEPQAFVPTPPRAASVPRAPVPQTAAPRPPAPKPVAPPVAALVPPMPLPARTTPSAVPPRPIPVPKPPVPAAPAPMRRPAQAPTMGRPVMADVTVPRPKPMGPIDEIAGLTIQEFRALSPNPREAAEKILERIDLLTEESYPLRAESVKAWRRSPLFRLYVELGQESLSRERSMEEVVNARQTTDGATLTLQEFSVIADLNRKLIP